MVLLFLDQFFKNNNKIIKAEGSPSSVLQCFFLVTKVASDSDPPHHDTGHRGHYEWTEEPLWVICCFIPEHRLKEFVIVLRKKV